MSHLGRKKTGLWPAKQVQDDEALGMPVTKGQGPQGSSHLPHTVPCTRQVLHQPCEVVPLGNKTARCHLAPWKMTEHEALGPCWCI